MKSSKPLNTVTPRRATARRTFASVRPPRIDSTDYSALRLPASPYDASLNLAAVAWLRELPQQVAPAALAKQFPRIANRLARFWDSPRMIDQYLEQLLIPKRGKRKGFPAGVLAELYALSEYHRARRSGVNSDLWDSLPYRKP